MGKRRIMHGKRRRRSSCSPMKYVDSSGAPLSQNPEELKAQTKENLTSDIKNTLGLGGKAKTGAAAGYAVGKSASLGLGAKGAATIFTTSNPVGWIALAAAAVIGGGIALGKGVKRKKQRKLFEQGYSESTTDAMEL
jgi:hypothetical protein